MSMTEFHNSSYEGNYCFRLIYEESLLTMKRKMILEIIHHYKNIFR